MATYPTPAAPPLHSAAQPFSQPSAPTTSLTRALVAAMFVFFFTTCALGVTAVMSHKFKEIFRDFGVALPRLSVWFLLLGQALRHPLGIPMAGMAVLLLSFLAGIGSHRRRWAMILCIMLAILGFAAYMIIFVAAMNVPLGTMIESLEQHAPTP